MRFMFYKSKFNSNITSMSYMFANLQFNNISNWNVENMSCFEVFYLYKTIMIEVNRKVEIR